MRIYIDGAPCAVADWAAQTLAAVGHDLVQSPERAPEAVDLRIVVDLTRLSRSDESSPGSSAPPSLILVDRQQLPIAADALRLAADCLVLPAASESLITRVERLASLASERRRLDEAEQRIHRFRLRQDKDHAAIHHVFSNAMRESWLDCSLVRHHLAPMSRFNGDLLLVAPGPSGGLYLMLGDFTGHGLGAAIGSLPTSRAFFAMARKACSVAEMAREINQTLVQLLPVDMFLCASLVQLHPQGNQLTSWNGGLHAGQIYTPQGQLQVELPADKLALGILPDAAFDDSVHRQYLEPDRLLYLYTDGLSEVTNASGEQFGEERVRQALAKQARAPQGEGLHEVIAAVDAFRHGAPEDDLSIVELRCDACPPEA